VNRRPVSAVLVIALCAAGCQVIGDIHEKALESESSHTDASFSDAREERPLSETGMGGSYSSPDANTPSDGNLPAEADVRDAPQAGDGSPDSGLTDAGDAGVTACRDACEKPGIGKCTTGTCVIDCPTKESCADTVVCPTGVPCTVRCGVQACPKGVNCVGPNCHIQCMGDVSCPGIVQCGGGKCTIECSQSSSCLGGAQCSATECHLSCGGASSCGGRVACFDTAKTCSITCGGQFACANTVEGARADAVIDCTGQQSCSGQVSCSGNTCSVFCATTACSSGVCCGARTCDIRGTANQCAAF
jgi:hypothetical protein